MLHAMSGVIWNSSYAAIVATNQKKNAASTEWKIPRWEVNLPKISQAPYRTNR
ncbi:MAG: hypothetical protein GWO21_05600 [Gammaproteobacteria bacterium]|nr:hypothetical protein [Gammaproteobacteria bacterium]